MKDATEGMKNMTKICRMYLGLKKCDKSISYENYNMGKNNVIMIKKIIIIIITMMKKFKLGKMYIKTTQYFVNILLCTFNFIK